MDFPVNSDFDYFLQQLLPTEQNQQQALGLNNFVPPTYLNPPSCPPLVNEFPNSTLFQEPPSTYSPSIEKLNTLASRASSLNIGYLGTTYVGGEGSIAIGNTTLDVTPSNNRKRLMTDPPDEVERTKVRKENQNLACRNYRRRKKEYLSELEAKISKLEQQNSLLKQQNHELKIAPICHKATLFELNPAMVAAQNEGRELCGKMEEAISSGDEKVMKYHLHLWLMYTERINQIAYAELDKIINPMIQAKLSIMGYVPDKTANIPKNVAVGSMEWFEMYKSIADLTPAQTDQLESLRSEYRVKEEEARLERTDLDKKIRDFLFNKLQITPKYITNKDKLNSGPSIDPGDILDFARNVHLLKKNYLYAKHAMQEAVLRLEQFLSTKQHLQLVALMMKRSVPPASFLQSFQLINKAYSMFDGKI